MRHERDERFAVRLLVQRDTAVRDDGIEDPLDVGSDVEEALGSEEVAGPRTAGAADEPQVLVEHRVRRACGYGHVTAAALGVEARGYGDRLDQSRLAAAVVAGEQRHVRVELELVELPDRGNRERIDLEVVDLVPLQDDRTDKGLLHETVGILR